MRPVLGRIAVFSVLALAAGVGLAQQAPAPAAPHPVRHRLRECLSILDLTDQQKSDIQAILEAAAPTLQADAAAVQTARQTLRTALDANPPDACGIGADALALKSARETLRADREAVRQQVLATLTPDQQARLEGCLAAPFGAATSAEGSEPESAE